MLPTRGLLIVLLASTWALGPWAIGSGSSAATKADRRPAGRPDGNSRVAPSSTRSGEPAPPKPSRSTPVPVFGQSDSGDALVEAVGATPELQGDQQFTHTINWTKRVITVMGIGVAPDRGSLAVRKTLAKSYALEDALRQLAEVVDKVRVNADAYLRDLTVADDLARSNVNARIRAARIVDTHVLPDGSAQLKVQLLLFTKEGLAGAISKDEPSPIQFAADATSSLPATRYSGIILDARSTGAQPALAPGIRSVDGQGLVDRPIVAYVHSRERADDLAGEKPLLLKVKRSAGLTKADLLLETADFTKLKDVLSRGFHSLVIVI